MEKRPTYHFYVQDFESQTALLTFEEIGVYIRLLNICWVQNGIPTNTGLLARICKISETDFLKYWAMIKDLFFEKDGKLFNEIQERTRQYSLIKSENGKKGGRPKNPLNDEKEKTKTKANQKLNESLQKKEVRSMKYENEIESEFEDRGVQGGFSENQKFQFVVDIFNSTCTDLPQVQKLNSERTKAIQVLLNEYKPENPNDFFAVAFGKVRNSDYLNGKINGWKATFDWIIKPNNFLKITEDNYENGKPKQSISSNRNR